MKKALVVALVLLSFIGTSAAYEIEGNPDRKISFGINYDRQGLNSEYKFGILKISDFTKVSQNSILADIKIPIASIFTFQIRGGYIDTNDDIFTGENVKSSGYDIGFGIRFYIP